MDVKKVFEAYPEVKVVYVVGGMPFVDKAKAENWAVDQKKEVQKFFREGEEPAPEEKEAQPAVEVITQKEKSKPAAPKKTTRRRKSTGK